MVPLKTVTAQRLIRSLIAGFALVFAASAVHGQETKLQLPTNDNTSSFNVTKNNGTSVLKVDGSGRITGDASGMSNVKPVAAYDTNNSFFELTPVAQIVNSVQLTVPSSGIVIVNATGFAKWSSVDDDVYRLCLSNATRNTIDTNCSLGTDYACPDSSDQYAPISLTRGFSVGSAGTYTYYLYGDNPSWASGFESSRVQIADVNMTAMYFPTGGTGKPALREKEIEVPSHGELDPQNR